MEDCDNEGVSVDRIKGPASEIWCHLLVSRSISINFPTPVLKQQTDD